MPKFRLILFLLFCCCLGITNVRGQRFSASISGGPDYYFNNIRVFKDAVRPLNYSFFGRIMWNSKYAASLGIETGYNKYYALKENAENTKASLAAIPFHLVIGMRFKKHFYSNFSFGPSILLNRAEVDDIAVNNKIFSYADGSLSVGYRRRINKRFNFGAELKFNFSTKAEDMNIAVPIVLTYMF